MLSNGAEPSATQVARLIIDVQQGLCGDTDVSFETSQLIDGINAVSERARAAGTPVIFIQHEGRDGYLEYGTDDWQLAHRLTTRPGDLCIRKSATDAFHRTLLEQTRRERGITNLVVCGMHSEFCVDTTTRRALALGFPVVLLADGHTTQDKDHLPALQIIRHQNATLTNITSFGPRVRAIPCAEVHFGP